MAFEREREREQGGRWAAFVFIKRGEIKVTTAQRGRPQIVSVDAV